MTFGYGIELLPGDKKSLVVKECEADDLDHAWDIARQDAGKMAVTARVVWVDPLSKSMTLR